MAKKVMNSQQQQIEDAFFVQQLKWIGLVPML